MKITPCWFVGNWIAASFRCRLQSRHRREWATSHLPLCQRLTLLQVQHRAVALVRAAVPAQAAVLVRVVALAQVAVPTRAAVLVPVAVRAKAAAAALALAR